MRTHQPGLFVRHLVGASLILLLTACAIEPRPGSARAERLIARLLVEAQHAFERKRLTTPVSDNAHQRYLRILSLDPENEQAKEGINTIVEQYLSWAMESAKKNRHASAANYLRRANTVDPEHPNILPATHKVNKKRAMREEVFQLDPKQLRNREVDGKVLKAIVKEMLSGDTFVVIRAPDDASGRWLYQLLNTRVPYRVQASYEASAAPAILVSR